MKELYLHNIFEGGFVSPKQMWNSSCAAQIFSSNKSVQQTGRKDSTQVACRKNEETEGIIVISGTELFKNSKIENQKKKIKTYGG